VEFDLLSNRVIGCALEVHRALGPGLLESAYEQWLAHELRAEGVVVAVQEPLPIRYKGLQLDAGYRVDLLVDNALVVELKAVERLLAIHEAQLLTYMKLADIKIGLLINFNTVRLRDGLKRFVL
jgi:GxxExxY protein